MVAADTGSRCGETQVETPPAHLVILYDGALRFLRIALEGLQRRDFRTHGVNLGRAQTILCELIAGLDLGAGEGAYNLLATYRYCLQRLLVANAEDRPEYVEEVIGLLAALREAGDSTAASLRPGNLPAPPGPAPCCIGKAL